MKYLRVLFLHFEGIFEHRFRSLVWFLIPIANLLPMLLFWTIAIRDGKTNISWSYQSMNTYYLFLIIAVSMISSHVEESVMVSDIGQGELSKYLLKPFSYYWMKMFEEAPHRILQGIYGIILFVLFILFFNKFIFFDFNLLNIILGIASSLIAFFISFTFYMTVGLTAFWFIESRFLAELAYIVKIIFSGQIIPLDLFPTILMNVSYFLPFPSMIYFPLIIFLGKSAALESIKMILTQIAWLALLLLINNFVWKKGLKKFTAVGQ